MRTHTQALARAWRKAIQPVTAANVNSVARKLEPKLKRRFLAAVATMKGNVDLEALAESLRVQSAVEAMTALHPETWGTTLTPAAQLLPQTFRQAGQVAASLLTQQLGIGISFTLTNPRAVQWARTQSSRLITDISESTREAVRQVITSGFSEGIAPRESARVIRELVGLTDRQAMAVINYRFGLLEAGRTAEDVARLGARYGKQLLNGRALNIARTETIAASANGQHELWRQAVDKGLLDPETTKREWILTPDDRLCLTICAPMENQQVGLEEPFTTGDGEQVMVPPAHPQCFVEGTRIIGRARAVAGLKAEYSGPVVMMETSLGHRLTVTPNHPILTPAGWVQADRLSEGDDVLSERIRFSGLARWTPQDQDGPTPIEQVVDALRRDGFRRVEIGRNDLHGDAIWTQSQIEIVGANRVLRDGPNAELSQRDSQVVLVSSDVCQSPSARARGHSQRRERYDAPSAGVPRTSTLTLNGSPVGLQERPLQALGFASAASDNPGLSQSGPDSVSVNAESLGQGLLGRSGNILGDDVGRINIAPPVSAVSLNGSDDAPIVQASPDQHRLNAELVSNLLVGEAGRIERDRLVSINWSEWHGHVYNLQTQDGVIIAEGIVTSNCRCAVGLSFNE